MILLEHNPNWLAEFKELEKVYIQTIGGLIMGIEHVGSTAVPGLMAKPIIDIDIVIKDYSVFPEVVKGLGTLGYFHNGDQGIFQREVFKRKDDKVPYNKSGKKWMQHHLYVCPEFSAELKRHLKFRAMLTSDRDVRAQYEQMKLNIAERTGNDRLKYADIKEVECKEFIYSLTDNFD